MTDKLTPKQKAFAEHIAMGLNPSDAYRAAGYKADKPETVATEAYRMLHHPQISPIIADLKHKAMECAVTTRTSLLDRVESINKQAYEEVKGATVTEAYRAFQAFVETYSILRDAHAEESWYSIAQAEAFARAEIADPFKFDFDAQKVWFIGGTE